MIDFELSKKDREVLDQLRQEALVARRYARYYDENEHEFIPDEFPEFKDFPNLYAHFLEGRIFPITYSVGDTLEGYATLRRLAESVDHIVPGHDPMVVERYPAARPGLDGVVRLDVAPK